MFDIGWGEIIVIGVVALIVIGPKELPGTLRTLGQWMTKIRRMAGEFQNQFQEAIREAELHDLKKEVDDMASQASKYTNFNPLDDVRRDVESAMGDMSTFDKPPVSDTPSVTTTSSEALPTAEPGTPAALGAPIVEAAPPAAAEPVPASAPPLETAGAAAKDAGKEPA
jgi:sec-independent protein translocase protein TatB